MISAFEFKKIYNNPEKYEQFQKTGLGKVKRNLDMYLERMRLHQYNEDTILEKYKDYKGNSNYIGDPELMDINNPILDDDDRNRIKSLMIKELNDEDFPINEETKTLYLTPLVNDEELSPVTLEFGLNHVTVDGNERVVKDNENMYLYGQYVGTLGDLKTKFSLSNRRQIAEGSTPNNEIYDLSLKKLGTDDELKHLFRIKKVNGGKLKSRYNRKSKKLRKNGRKSNRRR